VAYDPERELVASGVVGGSAEKVIGVWSLRDGTMQALGPADDAGEAFWGGYWGLEFLRDGSLLSQTREGLVRRWDLDDGSSELLFAENHGLVGVMPDGLTAVIGGIGSDGHGELLTINFSTNEIRHLEGSRYTSGQPSAAALSAQGDAIAIGFQDGTIQVGRIEGGEPYLLFGGEAQVLGLAFSPDGSLLASGGQDGTIRVWPTPDLSKPPPLALANDELLAKLDTFTNLRVVRDEASPTGWKAELGPFPGWETVPEW
jgi:WD40 repeat protein